MDRPSGTVIRRRIEHSHPGEQVQIDVKKLGRIPPGGGWRAWGRANVVSNATTRVGYAFVHVLSSTHEHAHRTFTRECRRTAQIITSRARGAGGRACQ